MSNSNGRLGFGRDARAVRDAGFTAYVEAHGRSWERYAFLLTGDSHRAQDLVQTVLLKLYRHWSRVAAIEQPDSYVRRMLTNAYLDQRRRRSSGEIPTDQPPDQLIGDIAARVVDRDELRRALDQLTPQQRTVLVLRHVEGLGDDAIAELLGCSAGTVRSHAARGRERFRLAIDRDTAMASSETRKEPLR